MSNHCLVPSIMHDPDNLMGGADEMLKPDEISGMRTLWQKGWHIKQIARELGHGKNTVRKFVRAWEKGEALPEASGSPGRRRGLACVPEEWLKASLITHKGNADVVRQDIKREFGIATSLRTVERAVVGFRQEIRAEAVATVRFETAPGKQIQVDFGSRTVEIGGARVRVRLCVLTLGYSRRIFVQAFRTERQADWFAAIEGAFRHFGGITEEILVDNAKALVDHNDGDGNVKFNAGFKAFCDHWGVRPKACRPYRARTKGKDERAVQYVKNNALAGRTFASWSELEAHLAWWMREIADVRVHQTIKEQPIVRFAHEHVALLPVDDHRSFQSSRTWQRVVKSDATVDVLGNSYSVPYRIIGKSVAVTAHDGRIEIRLGHELLACHDAVSEGGGTRVIAAEHLKGVMRLCGASKNEPESSTESKRSVLGDSTLLRPLDEYQAFFDGTVAIAVGGAQ